MNNRARVFFLFFVSIFAIATPVFAINSGKIYLPKENVALYNNQILVGNGSKWIPTDCLSADEKGFYLGGEGKNHSLFQWECPKCGHDNWFWDDYCWICGYER